MKAIDLYTDKEILPGDPVFIHKQNVTGNWNYTGQNGIFEEVTKGGLINFSHEGKPRQCLPEGIGAKVE